MLDGHVEHYQLVCEECVGVIEGFIGQSSIHGSHCRLL